MGYIINHWRGNLSLRLSFWVNFIALLLVISVVESFLLKLFASESVFLLGKTVLVLLVSKFIIFPWQLVGLIRAADQHYLEHRNVFPIRMIQAVIVLSVLFVLVSITSTLQTVFIIENELEFYASPVKHKGYQLTVQPQGEQLRISGTLDIGLTAEVRDLLKHHPDISSVLLESPGGQIYQGRGLGSIIAEYQFDTIVYGECSSACVTAYVNGKHRYLGQQGKLGFHQYRFESRAFGQYDALYESLGSQQQRDLELFKSQGIRQAFLDRMFSRSSDGIWFPESIELLETGVVHEIIPDA